MSKRVLARYTLCKLARRHPKECKACGARWPHVYISATGLCPPHSIQRMHRNVTSLRDKRGPDFERWARGLARGIVRTVDNAKAGHVLDASRDET